MRCANGHTLIISSPSTVRNDLGDAWTPYTVMLEAMEPGVASRDDWKGWVEYLVGRGASFFVCVGPYSEALHDRIDDCLIQMVDESEDQAVLRVLTTFHANESLEEAVRFFLEATQLESHASYCHLAILNEGEGSALSDCLTRLCCSDEP